MSEKKTLMLIDCMVVETRRSYFYHLLKQDSALTGIIIKIRAMKVSSITTCYLHIFIGQKRIMRII